MSEFTAKRIDDMEAIYGGAFKRVRAELGLSSFGVQVVDLPPGEERYPAHDHASDGQEELYLALRGEAELEIAGTRHPLDPETMIRVAPGVERKLWPGDEGVRALIVGAVPGQVYEAPDISQLGAPDPSAQQG